MSIGRGGFAVAQPVNASHPNVRSAGVRLEAWGMCLIASLHPDSMHRVYRARYVARSWSSRSSAERATGDESPQRGVSAPRRRVTREAQPRPSPIDFAGGFETWRLARSKNRHGFSAMAPAYATPTRALVPTWTRPCLADT